MARTSTIDDGSLELLLDTICNTFGGILFIALLVAIMMNSSGVDATQTTPEPSLEEEMLDLQSQIAMLQQEQDVLERGRQSEAEAVRAVFEQEFVDAIRELEREQAQEVELSKEHSALLKDSSERQASVNAMVRDRRLLADRVAIAEQEKTQTLVRISQLVDRQETRVAAAREVDLPNHQFEFLFLKGGRLTSLRPRTGLRIGQNHDEMVYTSDGAKEYAGPRDGAGLLVSKDVPGQVDDRLKPYNPRRDVIELRLWPDSFSHWQVLRDRIIAIGFHYRLVLIPHDTVRFPLGERAPGATGQ